MPPGLHFDNGSRWPLALRFVKGAIHHRIVIPVLAHAIWTAGVVTLDHYLDPKHKIELPSTIVR